VLDKTGSLPDTSIVSYRIVSSVLRTNGQAADAETQTATDTVPKYKGRVYLAAGKPIVSESAATVRV